MPDTNIPTKKMPKKITKTRLRNIAMFYLERFESSKANLRDVLRRRILKYKSTTEKDFDAAQAFDWVEEIITDFVRLDYLNDERFAEMKINDYLSAGKPERYIKIKLKQKGIDENTTDKILQQKEFSPFEMALHFAKKKKIGAFCENSEKRKENRQKDLGKLVRAGFDYDTALQVIDFEEE